MNKVLTIAILLIVGISTAFSQTTQDTIRIKKVFLGHEYYKYNKPIDINQIGTYIHSNQQAYKEFKSAQSTNTFAEILGYAGGFMVGWPLGTALGGGKPNWTMAGIGVGILAVGIPLSIHADTQLNEAVKKYNSGMKTSSLDYSPEMKFGFTGNGVGLILKF